MIYSIEIWALLVSLQAQPDVKIELGRAAVIARASGIAEAAVPLLRGGAPLAGAPGGQPARFKIVEIFANASSHADYPLIWSDLIAIAYVRPTYQKPEGPGAQMGTSIIGAPSFRPQGELLRLVPEVTRAEIRTGGPDLLRVELAGRHGTQTEFTSVRTYRTPELKRSSLNMSVKLAVREAIRLDGNLRGFDAFRLLSVSSMFASAEKYDANIIRYEDRQGTVQTVRLGPSTPRDAHLLPRGTEIGSFFELVKTRGSTFNPDSPSVRVEIRDRSGVPGRLGLQGFLQNSTDPNDDSLSVWVEWLDAPETVGAGTTVGLEVRVIAFPATPE